MTSVGKGTLGVSGPVGAPRRAAADPVPPEDVAVLAALDDALDRADTVAEVDATYRTLRRVALGYFSLFLIVVVAGPVMTLALGWWSDGRVLGGMSPSFVMAAFGLYAFFFLVGLAVATLSSAVEARMLGGPASDAGIDDPP